MTAFAMEMVFPSNWSFEGEVDICYVDASTGAEKSYGTLAQGKTKTQETFAGHCWNVRESRSRELLVSFVASQPPGNAPMVVTIGADGAGLDPLKASLWRMGRAPREPLLAATTALLKVLSNVIKSPSEPKYRSLRAANEKVAAALDVPGVLALLGCAGFEQQLDTGEARLVLPSGRPTAPVEAAHAQLNRLECLLTGKPPPSESLASMHATAVSRRPPAMPAVPPESSPAHMPARARPHVQSPSAHPAPTPTAPVSCCPSRVRRAVTCVPRGTGGCERLGECRRVRAVAPLLRMRVWHLQRSPTSARRQQRDWRLALQPMERQRRVPLPLRALQRARRRPRRPRAPAAVRVCVPPAAADASMRAAPPPHQQWSHTKADHTACVCIVVRTPELLARSCWLHAHAVRTPMLFARPCPIYRSTCAASATTSGRRRAAPEPPSTRPRAPSASRHRSPPRGAARHMARRPHHRLSLLATDAGRGAKGKAVMGWHMGGPREGTAVCHGKVHTDAARLAGPEGWTCHFLNTRATW
jgi:hypothetical protein